MSQFKLRVGLELDSGALKGLQGELDAAKIDIDVNTETAKKKMKSVADTASKSVVKQKMDIDTSNAMKRLQSMSTEMNNLRVSMAKSSAGNPGYASMEATLTKLKADTKDLRASLSTKVPNNMFASIDIAAEKTSRKVEMLEAKTKELNRQKNTSAIAKDAGLVGKSDLLSSKMDVWLKKNSAAVEQFGARIKELQARLIGCSKVEFDNIMSQFSKIQLEAQLAGKAAMTFGDKLKMQWSRLGAYMSISMVMMEGIQLMRSMGRNVLEVDTAMTELYRVTDLTASGYSNLYSNMIVSAKEYGTTLTDMINATADWSRAGFSPEIANGLAEVTTMYQHIADLDYDESVENLLTSYKGFESQLKEEFNGDAVAAVSYISDMLNELDNNYAVTAGGMGEAMKRSASALEVGGNTIQEAAALVGAVSEVTQDPEKAGNAINKIVA